MYILVAMKTKIWGTRLEEEKIMKNMQTDATVLALSILKD